MVQEPAAPWPVVLVRHGLPVFIGVLELPDGWNEAVFDVLIEGYAPDALAARQGTLRRHRGMPTLRDQLWQERNGTLPRADSTDPFTDWFVSRPGDDPLGFPPGTLDRIELGIPEGADAVVFRLHANVDDRIDAGTFDRFRDGIAAVADRLGVQQARADFAPRFLADGCDWAWAIGAPQRPSLLPMPLNGPWGAFDPMGWPLRPDGDRLYGEQDAILLAGFDAGQAGWTDEWMAAQPPGFLDDAQWHLLFADAYNAAPRIPGTECRVHMQHRNVIVGMPVASIPVRWHETQTIPVQDYAAQVESMQRALNAAGVPARAALHAVAEVDRGD